MNNPELERDNPPITIPVVISMAISKIVDIKTTDYSIVDTDFSDGEQYDIYDLSNCDLHKEVLTQIDLVNIKTSDWNIDEIEVIKNL